MSRHEFDLINNLVLWGSVVLLIGWLSAIVGAIRYSNDFREARVSTRLTWALLILAPVIGMVFFYAVRPRLKRARVSASTSA